MRLSWPGSARYRPARCDGTDRPSDFVGDADGTVQMEAGTRLAETLRSGRLALTAWYVPPPAADAEAITKRAASFPRTLDAVVVADNHRELSASALACSSL